LFSCPPIIDGRISALSTAISKAAAATDAVQERVVNVMEHLKQDFRGRIVDG